jgi:hypothetical protein
MEKLRNTELRKLSPLQNIIRVPKPRNIRWGRNTSEMTNWRVHNVGRKPEGKRPLCTPRQTIDAIHPVVNNTTYCV